MPIEANHDKDTILKELVSVITTNTKLLKRVNDKPLHSRAFSAEDFPAIDIAMGGDMIDYMVTCQRSYHTNAIIRCYSNKGQSELYGIMTEIEDILEANHDLNGKCENMWTDSRDPPRIFDSDRGVSLCDLHVIINYWRSY